MESTAPAGRPLDLVRPMLATPGSPPQDDGWAVEFKWDGYRGVAHCRGRDVQLISRNDLDFLRRFPELSILPDLLHHRTAVLDGEIVAMDQEGRPDFGLLQQRDKLAPGVRELRPSRPRIAYFVFDLLHLDGRSLLSVPYDARRAMLAELGLPGDHAVQVPPAFPNTDPADVLHVASQYGFEGIVSKRVKSRYEPGRRSPAWVKTPFRYTQEVVIGGWRVGQGNRAGRLGSLLLGAHDGRGGLVYVGHVGTGFSRTVLADLQRELERLERPTSPFAVEVPREHARHARWVEPQLVGEVEYRQWTPDGRLRHPAWRGMRPDRDPSSVELPPSR
ncbi:non-homologous end-joining DNA ligase [Lentzea flaviverrucosa]|uniref:DNA ligase (ATP) n=1 Tax=Lentzea flaviverrucosa TaxID=200379 RepID=A0A1H9XW11_9PSEU|nr:bifunctional non-homologous end joining protein LigD [Lentzea flaviverrucosa]SES50368.1 bifunctional non-homologous end joining protein LigD [Lentzea flaviverrucosa]